MWGMQVLKKSADGNTALQRACLKSVLSFEDKGISNLLRMGEGGQQTILTLLFQQVFD